jgi:hypothetical protein
VAEERQVDGTTASFSALAKVTVLSRVRRAHEQSMLTILFDLGIRTGSEVIEAIAAPRVVSMSTELLFYWSENENLLIQKMTFVSSKTDGVQTCPGRRRGCRIGASWTPRRDLGPRSDSIG